MTRPTRGTGRQKPAEGDATCLVGTPDTVLYALHSHSTEPHTYVTVERYRNGDALARHLESPYVAEAMSKLPDFLAKPPEMIELNQVLPG